MKLTPYALLVAGSAALHLAISVAGAADGGIHRMVAPCMGRGMAAADQAACRETRRPPAWLLRVAETPELDALALMARGDGLLATGDFAAARLFYSRAADAGNGKAATAMGTTFDPIFFRRWNIEGARPEPLKAEEWYRKAIALGETGATARLQDLIASGALPQVRPDLSAALTPLPGIAAGGPAKGSVDPLTRESIETILRAGGASYRMIPPEEFKIAYPGIAFAWLTSDDVFGAVIQVSTGTLLPEDAALAFITKINSGCTGNASVTVSALDPINDAAQTRRARSECEMDSGPVKVNYAFLHSRAVMTVFMALSTDQAAAEQHSGIILSTIRVMIVGRK